MQHADAGWMPALRPLSRRRLLVGGAAAGALGTGIARAQTPVAANIPVWRYELIEARLPNGLQIVLLPSRRAPIVTHMVWYRVGSADEPAGQSGLAHFLEHLMFKGTGSVPAGELSRRVARTGGRDNAFTSFDYTGYYQTVAPQHLEMVMGMEADRMVNLQILESELVTSLTGERVEKVLTFAFYRRVLERGQTLDSIEQLDIVLERLPPPAED